MSIINDALKKTQQVRKAGKTKRVTEKAKVMAGPKPMAAVRPEQRPPMAGPKKNKPPATVMPSAKSLASLGLKADFWFTWKTAISLTMLALLLTIYSNYTRSKLTRQAGQVPVKSRVAFEGVFLADNNVPTALINQQPMHLGDTLKGMKIIAINQDSLDLQGDKGILELKAGAAYEL